MPRRARPGLLLWAAAPLLAMTLGAAVANRGAGAAREGVAGARGEGVDAHSAGGGHRRLQLAQPGDPCIALGEALVTCGDACVPMRTCGEEVGCQQLSPAGSFHGCLTGECIPYWEDCPLVIFIDPANVAVFERTESAVVYSVVLSTRTNGSARWNSPIMIVD